MLEELETNGQTNRHGPIFQKATNSAVMYIILGGLLVGCSGFYAWTMGSSSRGKNIMFNEAGWIPSIVEHVWDINHILDEKSGMGLILKALFGYNGNPSLTEVLAYLVYFAAIILGLRRISPIQEPDLQKV